MYNVHNRILLILFLGWLIGINLCGSAIANITGNALSSYDLIEENGEWSREFKQNVNLGMRGKVGFDNLLGINVGVVQRDNEWTLGQLSPTYTLSSRSKNYNILSGYSINMHRDVTISRLYNNLSVSLPQFPTFRLAYVRQTTKDIKEDDKINSTGSNIQLGVEDEIGPFRITVNRREYSLEDSVRGPKYDVKSSNTFGNAAFKYLYKQLFSLRGRYKIGQFQTKRKAVSETKELSQDFSFDFRISPISTIALSGVTIGRRAQRESGKHEYSNDSLTNRLQLMLQPVEGIFLNATYSRRDTSRDEDHRSSNDSKSIELNVEPWQNLTFSGNFTIYDLQESNKILYTQRKNFFYLRAEPIEGLRLLSRLHLSQSEDFVSGLRNHRNNVITTLEATPTGNVRTSISHDWKKFNEEVHHQVIFSINYPLARMLKFSLRYGKNISSEWEGSTTFLNCGLNYFSNGSYINLRYNRASRPNRSSWSPVEKQSTTQTFTVDFSQKVGRNNDLRLSYQSRISDGDFSYRNAKRISFRANIRF